MSVICQNFVQNAWRKDLCSNCFKSEADHSDSECRNPVDRGRYVPQATSVYQARVISPGIHWRPLLSDPISRLHDPMLNDKVACRDFGSQTSVMKKNAFQNGVKVLTPSHDNKGILKEIKPNRKPRRSSVGFAPEEPLVIGYGGNDYDSDEAAWELGSDDGSINLELLDNTDEERTITKMTKNNTEFNAVNDNLISTPTLSVNNSLNRSQQYSKPNAMESSHNGHDRNVTTQSNNSSEKQDKKLSFYYFSTKEEPPKQQISYSNHVDQVNYLNEYKEMSLITKDIPGILNNIQNNQQESIVDNLNKINNFTSNNENLHQAKCHEKSSSKYLLITKITDNGEGSSDSDYSTSKQTNGESSTDTDSFHDAEDTTITPCSSFLHGISNRQNTFSHNDSRGYVADKPFETSSVSSGDTSTLSDDSDFHNTNSRKNNKSKVHPNKSTKQSQNEMKMLSQEGVTVNNKTKSNLSNSYTESKKNNNRFRKDHSLISEDDVPSPNMNNKFQNELSFVPRESKKVSNKLDTKPTSSPTPGIVVTINVPETKKNNTQNSTQETNKSFNIKDHNYKTVHFLESAVTENINKKLQKEPNEVVETKRLPVRLQNNVEHITEYRSSQDPKSEKSVNSEHFENCSPNVPVSNSNDHISTNRAREINPKANALAETLQATITESCISNNQTARQHMLAECKKIASANDEWKSVQRHEEPTPPILSSNADPEDQPLSTNESCHIENDQPESNQSSAGSSPNSKLNRQTKLAALALELEKARCDNKGNELKNPPPPPPPEVPRYSTPKAKSTPKLEKQSQSLDTALTPKTPDTSGNYPSIRRGRSMVSSTTISKLASLPDLLPETTTTKLKKGRFSLKKLLKRGKDSDTLVINNSLEHNQKAWKRQTFDRSRLSLEIVHPMDFTSDSHTSTESTPTDDRHHRGIFMDPSGKKGKISRHNSGALRARSLSALPQLTSCVFDTSDAVISNGLHHNLTAGDTSTSLDRTRLDMPRKAGTVAERSKKYKAPRRTPSFSELRTPTPTSGQISGTDASSVEKPPKPPPPPRGKTLPPPLPPTAPPPSQSKAYGKLSSPARPPPPKGLDAKENGSSAQLSSSTLYSRDGNEYELGDYANLGDIRLHITPKKPGRPSAVCFARDSQEMDDQAITQRNSNAGPDIIHEEDNTYESVEAQEEEDHYTYLDDIEGKLDKQRNSNKNGKTNSQKQVVFCQSDGDKPPQRPDDNNQHLCSSRMTNTLKKPWLDLQASYAAIAAANYESLAEFITTAISEGLEKLQKTASSLRWNDFSLETEQPLQTLEDKFVYNATYKVQPDIKVTLMLTTQKQHTAQNSRTTTRPPVLASFSDYLPRKYIETCNDQESSTESTRVMIYVLERSKTTTMDQFAEDSSSYHTNQHVHLRNACFVLLQLIHTLKSLQAEGIEEIDYNLGRILLLQTDVDKPPILVLLPGDKTYLTMADYYKADVATRKTTLCQTTLQLLFHLLRIKDITELNSCVVNGEFLASPVAHTFRVISKVLSEEKASSLTQAKGLLEYMLWGPVDINTSDSGDIDVILQRWLDLQRAQMVKSLISNLHLKISSHTGFHVYEEYQLIFLLQATVKSLKDIIMKL